MSQNVLWMHHFHEYWSHGLKNEKTTFEAEMAKVIDYVKHNDFDRIIITMFEESCLQEEHYKLENYCNENGIQLDSYEYNYAWYRDEDSAKSVYQEEKFGKTWIQGTRGHHEENDVLEIEDWQHELKENGDKVVLGGAFAYECLDDVNTVLQHLEVDYEENQSLCVGYGIEYEFQGQSPDSLHEEYTDKINELEVKVQLFVMENDCDDDFESIMEEDRCFLKKLSNELNDIFNDDDFEIFNENEMWFGSSYDFIEEQLDDIMAYNRKSDVIFDKIEEWEEENPVPEKTKKRSNKMNI